MGPNYVLDKGYVATGSTAYAFGEAVTLSTANNNCARATSAGAAVLGVCQENVDVTKVTTGKAVVDIRIMGITRMIAGAAIARGAKVTNDVNARAVTAGAAGTPALGVALTPAAANGDQIDVLLTPYNTV